MIFPLGMDTCPKQLTTEACVKDHIHRLVMQGSSGQGANIKVSDLPLFFFFVSSQHLHMQGHKNTIWQNMGLQGLSP